MPLRQVNEGRDGVSNRHDANAGLAILGVVCLALGCARAAGTSESAEATPVPPVEQVTSANAYNQREDHFVDAVLAVESAD